MGPDGYLPLDARTIEAELHALWGQAADGAVNGLVRASSLTILVMLVEPALGERVDAVLKQVPAPHPCRVILVTLDGTQPRARLSAYCRPPAPARPPVCWEEVRLEGTADDVQRLMSAARVLILPNLPVQVWWPGQPDIHGPLFKRVVEIGDRVIVDSSQFSDVLNSLATYADEAEAGHGTVGFSDLGWRRLESWRLLLAQFFDDPADRRFLNYTDELVIRYEPRGQTGRDGFADAVLIMAWLASRLGWAAQATDVGHRGDSASTGAPTVFDTGGEITKLVFDDGGRTVNVQLESISGRTGGGLAAVELRAKRREHNARYSVERSGESGTSVAEIDGERREARVRLPNPSEADLLERELGEFGRDRIYEDALQLVRSLTGRAAVDPKP